MSESLTTREKVLGKEHPDTISSLANFGGFYWGWGKNDEAEKYYRESLSTILSNKETILKEKYRPLISFRFFITD